MSLIIMPEDIKPEPIDNSPEVVWLEPWQYKGFFCQICFIRGGRYKAFARVVNTERHMGRRVEPEFESSYCQHPKEAKDQLQKYINIYRGVR